jgi:hypothetical protein
MWRPSRSEPEGACLLLPDERKIGLEKALQRELGRLPAVKDGALDRRSQKRQWRQFTVCSHHV